MSKNYTDLKVYQLSFGLFINTHRFTFNLPKYETYELGSQLRRSTDSVNSNIVEGYGRKRYKKDFVKFLIYSLASNDETINHLEKLIVLYPTLSEKAKELIKDYTELGKRLNKFIDYVTNHWRT